MPHYLTRHLEALREFPHGDEPIFIGRKFFATPTDADYYVRHGMAKEAKAEEPAAAPEPPPAAPVAAPTTRGRRVAPAVATAAPTTETKPADDAAPQETGGAA